MQKPLKLLGILGLCLCHSMAMGQAKSINKLKNNTLYVLNYANDSLLSSAYLLNSSYVITCAHGVADFVRKDTTIAYNESLKLETYVEKYSKPSDPKAIKVGRDSLNIWSVSEVLIHPKYGKNRAYDIAILKLAEPIEPSQLEILPLKSPRLGDTILILGYSENSLLNDSLAPATTNLQPWYNVVSAVNLEGNLHFEFIDRGQGSLNALPFGRMTFPGDSGGPSFLWKDGRFYLCGIHVSSVRMLLDASGNTPEGFKPYSRDFDLKQVEAWFNSIVQE